jgi:hypothetical protein
VFLPSRHKFYRALRVSRYKFNRSRQTIMEQDFYWWHWRSFAVQNVTEPEICHGAVFKLRSGAGVRVQILAGFALGAGTKAKTVTNNLPILSVL